LILISINNIRGRGITQVASPVYNQAHIEILGRVRVEHYETLRGTDSTTQL